MNDQPEENPQREDLIRSLGEACERIANMKHNEGEAFYNTETMKLRLPTTSTTINLDEADRRSIGMSRTLYSTAIVDETLGIPNTWATRHDIRAGMLSSYKSILEKHGIPNGEGAETLVNNYCLLADETLREVMKELELKPGAHPNSGSNPAKVSVTLPIQQQRFDELQADVLTAMVSTDPKFGRRNNKLFYKSYPGVGKHHDMEFTIPSDISMRLQAAHNEMAALLIVEHFQPETTKARMEQLQSALEVGYQDAFRTAGIHQSKTISQELMRSAVAAGRGFVREELGEGLSF